MQAFTGGVGSFLARIFGDLQEQQPVINYKKLNIPWKTAKRLEGI